MKTGRITRGICALILFFLYITGMLLLDHLPVRAKAESADEIMEKDTYNGYGLKTGQSLANTILFEEDGKVCYSDRIFTRFSYEDQYIRNTGEYVQKLLEKTGGRIYLLPVPQRVFLEKAGDADREKYNEYIEKLEGVLPDGAVLVDSLPVLKEHEKEYVFYRTENAWTARGAYYASTVLGKKMQLAVLPFTSYEESMYNDFYGGLVQEGLEKYKEDKGRYTEIHGIPSDLKYYYTYPGSDNRAAVFDMENATAELRRPIFSISDPGFDSYIGGEFSYAFVQGRGGTQTVHNEVLLVITDSEGKVMLPYLADCYDTIIVINIQEDRTLPVNIDTIKKEYGITDVIYMQNASRMGNPAYSRALNGLIGEREEKVW